MKILAVETSCDDTGIAILEISGDKKSPNFNVLSNIIASQIEVHKKYGGVYPTMAKREHQRNLVPVFKKALKEAGMLKIHPVIRQGAPSNDGANSKFKILNSVLKREAELLKKLIPFLEKYENPNTCPERSRRIDLIAITNGPGLEPCLWVGVNFAKCLSYFWDIPIVPVNHIESHILVNLLENPRIEFPAIALVVSGGHTQIILVEKIGKYKILGETRDDAAGECFDKCAKILGLGYPGGPAIAKLADTRCPSVDGHRVSIKLPRPMINSKDYDFSFSGLKTAVLYSWQNFHKKNRQNSEFFGSSQKTHQAQIVFAVEIQQAIIDVLLKKTMKAAKDYKAKTIILGGGVSANSELRKQFLQRSGLCQLLVPPANLSTDNGLMVAIAGYFNRKNKTVDWKKIPADGNLRIR